ncbi:MAG: sensor histidine kinase, partial [Flavobacteriales bacterium]|nr:sensor histidine kinase [Flavobacteriales bacterium]
NSTILPVKNDKDEIIQYLVLQTDISKKKKMELENLSLRDQLIAIQEAERTRIAQDLHDGIMQMLAASNMQINALKAICNDHDEGHTSLNVLGALVIDLLKEARAISHDLSCTSLQGGIISGLNKTIESLCSECNVVLESNIEGKRFSEKLEIHVYRILQEIINNTIKHSKATELKIIINQENNNLYINTFDNGIGFDMDMINKKNGLGFSSLKNRAKLINGTVKIQSSPNNGVVYNIKINNIKELKTL